MRQLTLQEVVVVKLFVKLCDSVGEQLLPYGVLLGWIFQTGSVVDKYDFVDNAGRLSYYFMPVLQDGEERKDQLNMICQEGQPPALFKCA